MADLDFIKQSTRGGSTVLFALWGGIGLLIAIFAALAAPILPAIFVCLMWIGGMMFFGFLAVMGNQSYRFSSPAIPVFVTDAPRTDGLNEEYEGIPFMRLESGHIIAEFSNGKFTFENWDKFAKAAQRANPSPK